MQVSPFTLTHSLHPSFFLPSGNKKWKKTCCVPSFVLFLLVLSCLLCGLLLLAVFRVDGDNRTLNAVLMGVASVVGLALVLNCRTWWQVTDSVLHSQRKRLHSAANKMHKLKSEGFMKVGVVNGERQSE